MCHTWVYLLQLVFVSTVFWRLIFFSWYIRISLRIFYVPVKFIFQCVLFLTIYYEIIFLSTSVARIFFLSVMFITNINWVVWFKGSFLIAFFFHCCLHHFSVEWEPPQWLHLDWKKLLSSYFLPNFPRSNNQFVSQI